MEWHGIRAGKPYDDEQHNRYTRKQAVYGASRDSPSQMFLNEGDAVLSDAVNLFGRNRFVDFFAAQELGYAHPELAGECLKVFDVRRAAPRLPTRDRLERHVKPLGKLLLGKTLFGPEFRYESSSFGCIHFTPPLPNGSARAQ